MILVTGAAGFIGSNFVAMLNERGRTDLVLCDRLRGGGKWRNLRSAALADFILPAELEAWLARRGAPDAVIPMGAISATTATDGDEVIDTNGCRWHCSTIVRAGVPFLYVSSTAVYGDGDQGFDDNGAPEAVMRLRPLNLCG